MNFLRKTLAAALLIALTGFAGNANALSSRALYKVVTQYEKLSPKTTLRLLLSMPKSDHLSLSLSQQFAGLVYGKACQANSALFFDLIGQRHTCESLARSWRATAQLDGMRGALQEASLQRQQLITMLKCERGQMSKRLCGTYFRTQSNIGNMRHQTNMQIINNLPTGTCRRNIDPNCY
jgi:hypothetical protein